MKKYDINPKDKINSWTVVERSRTGWICECKCGTKRNIPSNTLINKKYKWCSNCRFKNLENIRNEKFKSGNKFNNWEIIELDNDKQKIKGKKCFIHYKCRCMCGNIESVSARNLLSENSTQCIKCAIKDRTGNKNKKWNGYKEIPGKQISLIKYYAKERKLDYNISPKYIWNLFLKQNRRCNLSGIELSFNEKSRDCSGTASLDRIDSTKGYIKDNVQWIHKDINIMKNNYSQQEYLDWCKKITEFQKEKSNE